MEQKKTRKEWIKTIAIIFLSIMLVLTFFSQTILNYSLPEVAAQYCYSGELTSKVRGSGTVESEDPYSVVFKETRKISSVKARQGEEIEKGDILYYLEEEESEEIIAAEKALKEAKEAYEKQLVTGGISSNISNAIENGASSSVSEKQALIDSKKSKIESLKTQVKNIQSQLALYDSSTPAKYVTLRQEIVDLETELAKWETQNSINETDYAAKEGDLVSDTELATLKTTMDGAKTAYDLDPSDTTLESAYTAAKTAYDKAKAAKDAKSALSTSKNKINEYQTSINTKNAELTDTIYKLNLQLSNKQSELANAEEDLSNLLSDYATSYTIMEAYNDIKDKEAELKKLKEEASGTTITAPVSGTIISMNYVAGETIEQGSEIASIQIAGKGYTLSMEVTKDQAKLISVGDEAEVVNSWWYSDVQARVTRIQPSKTNPQNGKVIIFELAGDVTSGQSLSLTVGRRTSNYDTVVPTSAIREDNNGKFVLKVVTKEAPFGNRYIAERVNVTVLAEDDNNSAVSGAFEGWDYIITTTSKPVDDGDQIRLKD